jgi:hypothetical protein
VRQVPVTSTVTAPGSRTRAVPAPSAASIEAAMRVAVVKSGCLSWSTMRPVGGRPGASRSSTAPLGMRATVTWFLRVDDPLPPCTAKPPVERGPWAMA